MPKRKKKSAPPTGFQLSQTQAESLMSMLLDLCLALTNEDGRAHHAALMLFTRDGEDDDGSEYVSTSVLATTGKDHLQHLLHGWIRNKIQ